MEARGSTPLVVDAAWLSDHLEDPRLVLLHIGDAEKYRAHHIPGARHLRLDEISVSDHSGQGLMLEMPPADELRRRLEAIGISNDSRVVVYHGEDWISPATRAIFTLDYAGLGDRGGLLDGGMAAWTRAGHEVTNVVPPPPQKGTLSPLALRPIVATAAEVRASLGKPGVAIIDARDQVSYEGTEVADPPITSTAAATSRAR
ncbi:MAG: rhodanese-like domain-containing protein [Minicystis sp.]